MVVASSLPFEANLTITDITINTSDNYKATFQFDLNKVLTGITNSLLEKEGVILKGKPLLAKHQKDISSSCTFAL